MKATSILLSFAFTIATIEALGLLLLQRLQPRVSRQEQYAYAFVTGSGVLSWLVFLLAAAHVVWTATFVILGVVAIGASLYSKAWVPSQENLPPLPRLYLVLLTTTMIAFGAWYFMNALAPEASADGSMYHLGLVQRYLDQHGFGRITTSMYASLPLAIEMLFLFAFSLGRHSAAALVHFAFLIALPLIMVVVGRRLGHPRAGAVAGILVFLSPVFGFDGSSAYVDVAAACVAFALFGILQIWDETREQNLLPIVGLLAGYAYSVKLTIFVAIPYAVLFVLVKLLRRRQPLFIPMTVVCGCVLLMVLPWLVKNAITVGNPFSPFLNRWFPNPHIHISFEQTYQEFQRNYPGLHSMWDIPVEATVRGGVLNGVLGPVFLLAPLGLLAMRGKLGRQSVLAALVFLAPYPANVGTRFLIPAAPFLAFAIALTLQQWRGMAPLVVLFHAFISWPDVAGFYTAEHAWRLDKFYWRGAFRLQPESEYLNERMAEYATAKLAERVVPKNGRIFTLGGIAHAYCRREVVVFYESALGNRLFNGLAAAILPSFQPLHWWNYEFPKQPLRRLRLAQTEASKSNWNISEIRLLGADGRLLRAKNWKLRSDPNPWDVQLAFDNCPTTRWTSGEAARPGMFIEVELAEPTELTGVRAEVPPETIGNVRLEAERNGQWKELVPRPVVTEAPPLKGTRRLATDDLKRSGMTHIAVNDTEFFAADMTKDPKAWGVTQVGESGKMKVYRID
ncbi:MAG TPA: glycosyltransferase family 39 protein [Bryobacteraceae bacterium]|nr:glycosyltransferase family 39 protein [Bryobacteraceae bacterium]